MTTAEIFENLPHYAMIINDRGEWTESVHCDCAVGRRHTIVTARDEDKQA